MIPRIAEYVVFDVETTGLSPVRGDRIIEIAAVRVKNGKVCESYEQFINPERDIPMEAQQINNITNTMVCDAPKADVVLPEFLDFIKGSTVVGHNVRFDINFLIYQLSFMGRRMREETPVIDTLKMAKHLLPHLTRHTLSYVSEYLGVQISETHRALADVTLTVDILNKFLLMAEDQNIKSVKLIQEHYGVTKPSYKIQTAIQDTFF